MSISVYTPSNSKIVHYTYADFISRQIGRPVHIVQYDDCVPVLAVRLYRDGQKYYIPSNADAYIRMGKPDGKFIYNPALGCDTLRQTVYFEVTPQMAAFAGTTSPVVEITNEGLSVSSSPIGIIIDRNPVQDSEIASTSEYKSVVRYAKETVDAVASASASRSASKISETNAKTSETNAKASETNAKTSETNAKASETKAKTSETNAKTSETNAKAAETNARQYADSWKGSLLPKGFITFSQLPTSGNVAGHMYHITHAFTTDYRFKDGSGYSYPAGTNVYWTSDGKWDCLSGNITKQVSQAEYDALTQEEKMNGTIYYISDSDNLISAASDTVAGIVKVDKLLSSTSENPVQNKVVKTELDKKANLISPALTGTPTAPTAPNSTNNTQIATTAFVKTIVNALINGAPETLDTLKELADAVTANKTVADALNSAIGNKVDKVSGKGLSTNDYTTAEKNKLGGIAANANNYVLPAATSTVLGGVKVQNNLTSDSTSDSLSAAQGKALANGSARDNTKLPTAGGTISGALTVAGATTLEGSVRIKPSGKNYGSVINIGDGTYIQISEDTDDVLTIKAKQLNLNSTNTNGVYVNGETAARFKKLTQAEYNALPSSKSSDNIIYFITG